MSSMKTMALLTSGGDAPGMNAAIRAATLVAAQRGIEVVGVERGYEGLLDRHYRALTREVDGGLAPTHEVANDARAAMSRTPRTRSAR